jgi:hypothetical protein
MAAKKSPSKKVAPANPFVEQAEKDAPPPQGKTCQTCKSPRLASITGKSVDLNNVQIGGKEHDGHVPTDMGIGDKGYGDYIEIDWCLNCGQIQGRWPRAKTKLEKGQPV